MGAITPSLNKGVKIHIFSGNSYFFSLMIFLSENVIRLVSGSIRFENRVIKGSSVQSSTILGKMTSEDQWTFFCELSAFGVQEKTSAAVVTESDPTTIYIIPIKSFHNFVSAHPDLHLTFFQFISQRLARMLRGLHSRTLSLSSVGSAYAAHQIHNQAAVIAWPSSTKGVFGKNEGLLVLSRDYLSFLKKKIVEQKGVVCEATENDSQHILELFQLKELIVSHNKLTISDGQKKVALYFKKSVSPEDVRGVIVTARNSLFIPSPVVGGNLLDRSISSEQLFQLNRGLRYCSRCKQTFCTLCQCQREIKNSCSEEREHILTNMAKQDIKRCSRCSNEGTHVLLAEDLQVLLQTFSSVSFSEGETVQAINSEVKRIGYVLKGKILVFVRREDQKIELSPVIEGEIIGEIGAILKTYSSAQLVAGEGGCWLLEIPVDFLFDEQDPNFKIRVYISLIQLMWERIIRQESVQIKNWKKCS